MRINAVKGAMVIATASMFAPEAAQAFPDTPSVVASSPNTYTTEFTLTEQCSRASQIIGSVAVQAHQAETASNASPKSQLQFNKILEFGLGLCGDDNKIVNTGIVTRDKATRRPVKVTLKTAGVEISRPRLDQSSKTNCAPLRANDTDVQRVVKVNRIFLNNLQGKTATCDTGFVGQNGLTTAEPTDENIMEIFPAAYKTSEAALTADPKLDKVIREADKQRLTVLRNALRRKFQPKAGKAPTVIINHSPNGVKNRRKDYVYMTSQANKNDVPVVTTLEGTKSVASMRRGNTEAKGSVKTFKLRTPASKFAITEDIAPAKQNPTF